MTGSSRIEYTVPEIIEGSMGGLTAVAVLSAIFPGFLLTVPALVLVLLPVVLLGLVAALAVLAIAVATVPAFVGWRVARRAWRSRPALRMPHVPAMARRARPTARHPAL